MKILFVLLHPGYLRHYESTIAELARRGHRVHLAFTHPNSVRDQEGDITQRLATAHPGISHGTAPKRGDAWSSLANLIRGMIDVLRYLHPRYAQAPKLRSRVGLKTGELLARVLHSRVISSRPSLAERMIRLLQRMETSIPSSVALESYLREGGYDRVLVSPLVNFASRQEDYVKSARHLGLPVALCVASWDNLSNKGLIRQSLDAVMVWNQAQKTEAMEMHGVAEDRIWITGAQSYDHWFERRPRQDADEFCARLGLSASTSYVLYLCSSKFIGGDQEVNFVRRWVEYLRGCGEPRLREIGILVRPHFENAENWRAFDSSGLGNFAIHPLSGANPITEDAKADFFDSIYHSSVVVGINTSGMIEAGILSKPILTIMDPAFEETQTGTLHFHYLTRLGLVQSAHNLPQHSDQLTAILNDGEPDIQGVRQFISEFVRPFGLKQAAMPRLARAIEEFDLSPQDDRLKSSRLIRTLLYPLLPIASMINKQRIFLKKRRKYRSRQISSSRKSFSRVGRHESNIVLGMINRLHLKEPMQRFLRPITVNRNSVDAIKKMHQEFAQVLSGTQKVIIGPWFSEVGFELLYWLPLLRQELRRHRVDPQRLVVISRGGAIHWYQGIAAHSIDIYDLFDADRFREMLESRLNRVRSQKQSEREELDEIVLNAARKRLEMLETTDVRILHPQLMYQNLRHFWHGYMGMHYLSKNLNFNGLPPGDPDWKRRAGLPECYIAVRFYFRPSFPDNAENRHFIQQVLSRLSAHNTLVLLNPGRKYDDHWDFEPVSGQRIFRIDHLLNAANNLEVQSRVIEGAQSFVGTYGGLSYLPLFYGVPSLSFYSNPESFVQSHQDVANQVARLRGVSYTVLHTDAAGLLGQALGKSPPARSPPGCSSTDPAYDHIFQ
jgi:hypothetical protein